MGSFKFGAGSKVELEGVHPLLRDVHRAALERSGVDYGITDGPRTEEEQAELVRIGASKTMRSRHLRTRGPGESAPTAKATDAVPFVHGKYRWEWAPIFEMAAAIHSAARELQVPLRWGAVWDRAFLELDPGDLQGAVDAYVGRRRAAGRRAFLDGPHFELPRALYP